jgi:hypothetical protein
MRILILIYGFKNNALKCRFGRKNSPLFLVKNFINNYEKKEEVMAGEYCIKGIFQEAQKQASVVYTANFPAGVKSKVKKKFNGSDYYTHLTQSSCLMGAQILDTLLAIGNEIEKNENWKAQEKFDLLIGDIEAMAVGLKLEFDKNFNARKFAYQTKASIEDLKRRKKGWSYQMSGREKEEA